MYTKTKIFIDIEKIESQMGCNVFEIKKEIDEKSELFNEVNRLFTSLQKNKTTPNQQQSSAISRIFAVFAWSCKIAVYPQEKVFEYLEMAIKFAITNEEKGLCSYVKATLLRGYSKSRDSEIISREMLDNYYQKNTEAKIHGLNCLALALLWQDKKDEAIIEFKKALEIKKELEIKSIDLETKTDRIIITAEGDSKDRTLMNLAQAYSKMEKPELALGYALQALDAKNESKRPAEDIAYTKIVVGEIYSKLKDGAANAKKFLLEAIETYDKLYDKNTEHQHRNRAKKSLEQLEVNFESFSFAQKN